LYPPFENSTTRIAIIHVPYLLGENSKLTTRVSNLTGQSREKKIFVPLSLCPGTRAGAKIPGQTPLFQAVPGTKSLPECPKINKRIQKNLKKI
jgi:hypothetical protein